MLTHSEALSACRTVTRNGGTQPSLLHFAYAVSVMPIGWDALCFTVGNVAFIGRRLVPLFREPCLKLECWDMSVRWPDNPELADLSESTCLYSVTLRGGPQMIERYALRMAQTLKAMSRLQLNVQLS